MRQAWQKNPPTVAKLMGDKTKVEKTTNPEDFIKMMRSRARANEKEEIILLEEVVTLTLDGDVPVSEWYALDDVSDEGDAPEGEA